MYKISQKERFLALNKEKAIAAAKKFIEKGQIDKAILEYKRIVEAEPEDVKSMQKLAELCVRQGSRQEAINLFLKLADLLIRQGFSNRAISIYKQILQLNPLLIPVYIKLSEIFKTLGLSKDARIFNQRAVEIVQKAGSIEDVYKLIIKIIEIDPDDVVSRIALAETCLKMNKIEAAIEQFEAALPILREQHLDDLFIRASERLLFHKPDNVDLCRELSIIFMMRKEIPKAMKLLLHCRKLDPEDLDTLDLLISHFLSSQNHEKAVLVLLEKSKLLSRKGREDDAQQALRKILEIDPNNQEARRSLKDREPYSWEDIHPPRPAAAPQRAAQPPPQPPPPPPARQAAAAAPVESAVQEEIESKFIQEAEIFIKYGLKEKALEHLFRGIEETYGSVKVREKLKDLYLDVGEINLGLEQLYLLAQQIKDYNPGAARLYLKEVLLINPRDAKATKMLESSALRRSPRSPRPRRPGRRQRRITPASSRRRPATSSTREGPPRESARWRNRFSTPTSRLPPPPPLPYRRTRSAPSRRKPWRRSLPTKSTPSKRRPPRT
jgi:pilus assembly protein FimV